ncbi:hypothetical protein LEN26_020456 [Aphanomyces euteiches]|nr:hypothetical protein LEN26_020456 [Aphanomyces euteiches]KAH9149852.1 hypothetical protein AeRB84_007207 [Aphanomyces euteiches]KAH9194479.1 hypothetical protein AeNC1_003556 [Aphanomyces euteiches]
MTERFQEYYEAFKDARNEAMNAIRKMPDATSPQEKSQLERDARAKIEDVQRYFRILEQEGRGGTAHEKRKMQVQLRSCQSDIEKLNNNLNKALLVDQAQTRAAEPTLNPQAQAAAYQERMDRTGDHLNQAKTTIVEIEQIGANVSNTLATDRERLERAQENVQNVREDTEEAKWHLGSLARKAFSNIILLWLVILGLIAAIIYTLYKRLVK